MGNSRNRLRLMLHSISLWFCYRFGNLEAPKPDERENLDYFPEEFLRVGLLCFV